MTEEERAVAEAVILDAVRTPFGRRGGAYREVRPDRLLALALRGLVDRAGLDPSRVEDVIAGTVTQAGEQGANVGRLAVLLAGFPVRVPAVTLNRMCGSSQQSVHFAAQAVAAGDMAYVVAAGVESMTRVPMFSDIGGGFDRLNPDLRGRYDLIHQGESRRAHRGEVGDRSPRGRRLRGRESPPRRRGGQAGMESGDSPHVGPGRGRGRRHADSRRGNPRRDRRGQNGEPAHDLPARG